MGAGEWIAFGGLAFTVVSGLLGGAIWIVTRIDGVGHKLDAFVRHAEDVFVTKDDLAELEDKLSPPHHRRGAYARANGKDDE